jgi:hypothetical protein
MKDVLARVLQEDRCSSMYSNYMHLSSCNIMYSRIALPFLYPGNLICNIDWCIFRRLKPNHDYHEFILESGNVANTKASLLLRQ